MAQSTKITVALLVAFVIYTTMKGNLRHYLQVIGIAN